MSGQLCNREWYSIFVYRDKKQSNDPNINDEMVQPDSFSDDGGGFECSVIAVFCLFLCVLVWKMTKTLAVTGRSLLKASRVFGRCEFKHRR